MSDSDDTDFLLLIPPSYFIASAEEKLQREQLQRRLEVTATNLLNATIERILERNHQADEYIRMDADAPLPPPTAAYQFLPPSRKAELNNINTRLHTIENEETNQHQHHHFAVPSDISTVSNCTVRTQFGNKQPGELLGIVHSTPKRNSLQESATNAYYDYADGDDDVLLEIDNFLDDSLNNGRWKHYSDNYRLDNMALQQAQAKSLPDAINQVERAQTQLQITTPKADCNLISLSEIWGKSGQNTAIETAKNSALKEEQLRRQHLEKTVRLLQSRLLEYQQRLSVAIEVDRTKDAALASAQLESKNLNMETQKMRDALYKLELEQQDYNVKMDMLQKELAQAVSLATKFQEKNEKLETELMVTSRKTNECNAIYKQQVEELELKLHGCKRAEECAINESNKLKDKLAKAEYQSEKLKLRCDDLEKDNSTLKHQKEMLQDYHQKQKSRADALETQRKSLQESLAHLTENETSLKKKLEIQQKSLKSHYQQQLENVVAQKLKEFQMQLDKMEENLKAEARERERLIADRAVKQLELINEKNEQELNLLQEKHNEEVELYRIQLANASKKIDDLERKLECYKSKRADIAEKLHNIMEKQWQKTLEILTSPSQLQAITDYESPENNETHHNNENDQFETPKNSRHRKSSNTKENNLDIVSNKTQPPPMDRLQAYIELLLSKSPSDFEKLDEILALSKKSKSNAGKLDKSTKRNAKPPWKA